MSAVEHVRYALHEARAALDAAERERGYGLVIVHLREVCHALGNALTGMLYGPDGEATEGGEVEP